MSEPLWLAIILGFVVTMLILALAIVGGIAFYRAKSGTAKSFTQLFRRADAPRLLTVAGIVFGTILLALGGQLKESAVSAILSGVAGYVLGSSFRDGRSPDSEDTDEDEVS